MVGAMLDSSPAAGGGPPGVELLLAQQLLSQMPVPSATMPEP